MVAEIPGRLVSFRAGISVSRLSEIERGLVPASPQALGRIERALDALIAAKRKVAAVAQEVGWPL
jgi:transcriptional regulator with XRE-family HTH domain